MLVNVSISVQELLEQVGSRVQQEMRRAAAANPVTKPRVTPAETRNDQPATTQGNTSTGEPGLH